MKFTYDSRELSGESTAKIGLSGEVCSSAAGGAVHEVGKVGGGLKGATVRLVVVVAVFSLLFFVFARSMFATFIVGTLTMALQAMMIEVIYEVLLRREKTRIGGLAVRPACQRRREAVVWCVQVIFGAVVLAALAFYFHVRY